MYERFLIGNLLPIIWNFLLLLLLSIIHLVDHIMPLFTFGIAALNGWFEISSYLFSGQRGSRIGLKETFEQYETVSCYSKA